MSEMLKERGERMTWRSRLGQTVTMQRTDSGQAFTVERRSTCGQTVGDLAVFGSEAEARACARFLAETIRDLEVLEGVVL